MVTPTVDLQELPRPWRTDKKIGEAAKASVTCFTPSPTAAGFPTQFSNPKFIHFWATQSKLLKFEAQPATAKLLDELVIAYAGMGHMAMSIEVVGHLLNGWQPDMSTRHGARQMLESYNTSFYAPEIFLDAVRKLSAREELISATRDYFNARDQAYDEATQLISKLPSTPEIMMIADQTITNMEAFFAACQPRVAEAGLDLIQLKTPAVVPGSFPEQTMNQIQMAMGFTQSSNNPTIGALISRTNGSTTPLPRIRNGFSAAITYLIDREETNILSQIPKASLAELARFYPELVDFKAKQNSTMYGAAARKTSVSKAVENRRIALRGITANGADTRPFAEKMKVNAPPSEEDVLELATTGAMMRTQKQTGLPLRRESKDSFSFDGGALHYSGIAEISIYGLKCEPVGSRQRCSYFGNMVIKDNRLLGVRTYGLGEKSYKGEFFWSKDGLSTADMSNTMYGFLLPERNGGNGSSSAGYGGDRDADNLREGAEEIRRAQAEANEARRRAYEADQEARRAASGGRCRMGNICN